MAMGMEMGVEVSDGNGDVRLYCCDLNGRERERD